MQDLLRPFCVYAHLLQCLHMALAGNECALGTALPSNQLQQMLAQGIQTMASLGRQKQPIRGERRSLGRLRDAATDDVDAVEKIGIARAWSAIGEADAVLFVHDLTRLQQTDYRQADAHIAQQLAAAVAYDRSADAFARQ